jgi:nucleotide-binding universal stress UspA family protein
MEKVTKILVPVDFSENSTKLLQHAAGMAANSGASVVVMYVVEGMEKYAGLSIPHISLAEVEKQLMQSAKTKMERFLEDNMDPSVAHESIVLNGDIVDEINNYAAKEGIDMIIMGTHGYKGLEKVLFGSVAERIVKTAPCPVLTFNPYK